MKLLKSLLSRREQPRLRKTLADYQQELLIKQGREQFKKLVDRGLGIPVAYM